MSWSDRHLYGLGQWLTLLSLSFLCVRWGSNSPYAEDTGEARASDSLSGAGRVRCPRCDSR